VPSQCIKKWPVAVKRLDSSSKQGIRQWRVILFCSLLQYVFFCLVYVRPHLIF
jgi:hypothetical protein